MFAVANCKGELQIGKISDNFELIKTPSDDSIHLLKWLSLATADEIGVVNPLSKNSLLDQFLPQIEAHKGSKEDNIMKLNLCSMNQQNYSILFTVDASSKMALLLNGYFDLGVIDLAALLQGSPVSNSLFLVHDFAVSASRDHMAILHSEGGDHSKNMYLSLADFGFLRAAKDTIAKAGQLTAYLEASLANLGLTFDSMANSLKAAERAFNSPFYTYEDLLAKEEKTKNLTPAKDLARVLRTGEISEAFRAFIAETTSDKIVDMYSKVCIELDYVVELVTDSVQSAVDRCDLVVDLFSAELSKDDLYSGFKGLKQVPMHLLATGFSALFSKAEEFLFVIAETRQRIVGLLAWLYREAKKLDLKREEGQDLPEPKPEEAILKGYPVDKSLVLLFLQTEESFMARYLSAYLKPAPLPIASLAAMAFEVFRKPSTGSRRHESDGKPALDAAREQGLAFSRAEIGDFCRQLTGKALAEDIQPGPVRQEGESGSLRSLLKQVGDGLGQVKAAVSRCVQANARLLKSVLSCHADRPRRVPVQRRPAHFLIPRQRL